MREIVLRGSAAAMVKLRTLAVTALLLILASRESGGSSLAGSDTPQLLSIVHV
jgi:hypothetical protein